MHTNIHSELSGRAWEIKNRLSFETPSLESTVKSNVAGASAVTSNGRIHMIPYITLPGVVYLAGPGYR